MSAFLQDVRYAARSLLKARGFTLAAVVTLALGVGANTTIYSVNDALYFKAHPFPAGARVVQPYGTHAARGIEENDVATFEYAAWRDSGAFAHLAAYAPGVGHARLGGEPERTFVTAATADLFALLRARPLLGRVYTAEEDVPGHDGVVVLSEGLWRRRFGADPGVLGRAVAVNGRERTVVGVLPRAAQFPPSTELWVPMALSAEQLAQANTSVLTLGALNPELSEAQAREVARAASRRLEQERPDTNAGWSVVFKDPRAETLGPARLFMLVLAAAVGLVLLIACANVANLLLARASVRERELAVRAALGASRGRLVRQLLTESALLSVAGSALGLVLATWGIDAIVRSVPADRAATIPGWDTIGPDARVLGFTLALTLLTTLAFGLVPALRASRVDVQATLKQQGRGDPATGRLRGALVVSEVALSVVLLVCSGLLVQSLVRMQAAPLGFEPQGLLTVQLHPTGERYREHAARARLIEELLPRLAALPGVRAAGVVGRLPLGGSNLARGYGVEGEPVRPPTERPTSDFRQVSPGALAALGARLVAGRDFTSADRPGGQRVAIVNETFARRVFPGQEAVGKRLLYGADGDVPFEIVGVVADLRARRLDAAPRPEVMVPLAFSTEENLALVLRVERGDPAALVPALREAVAEVDADLPLASVRTYARVIADTLVAERVSGGLLMVFGVVALVLAGVGVFGVVSYAVSQRTYEIGVRMALGARQGAVQRQVLGGSLRLAGAGVVVGTLGAAALAQLLGGALYGVGPRDPATYAAVAGTLLAVALCAAWAPARRATRVDPAVALRAQ